MNICVKLENLHQVSQKKTSFNLPFLIQLNLIAQRREEMEKIQKMFKKAKENGDEKVSLLNCLN
jgi:hypothetical protein